MLRTWLLVVMVSVAGPVFSGVPVSGRNQHMLFSRLTVQAVAAQAYQRQLSQLAKRGMLDTDRMLLQRVRKICGHLIAQAILIKPVAATWPWEIHITSDPQTAAYSMGGGKLLVSSQLVREYQLSEHELAVALAHEIGHVIAEHVREQISLAASFSQAPPNRPHSIDDVINAMESDISVFLRLQPLSRLQEMEADDIGIELAARAGIPPSAIVSFYTKLARTDTGQSLFDTHGPIRQRVAFVESMAEFAGPVYEASIKLSLPSYAFSN